MHDTQETPEAKATKTPAEMNTERDFRIPFRNAIPLAA
jgi:hypothetical protein